MANEAPAPKLAPMRRCFNCGEALGRYWDHDRLDTCGSPECNREARNAHAEERDEAHRRVDREFDGGW